MSDEADSSSFSSDVVTWSDIEPAARQMFRVWMGSGEITWVKECWKHFEHKGLTRNTSPLEQTATHLRLLALVCIYEQFCGYMWDENPDTPLSYLTENLSIDPLSLGILAGSASPGSFDEECDEDELREAALGVAIDAMRDEIHSCLAEAYGGSVALYSRMSKTNRAANHEDNGSEFEVTGSNSSALQFVTQGFPA